MFEIVAGAYLVSASMRSARGVLERREEAWSLGCLQSLTELILGTILIVDYVIVR